MRTRMCAWEFCGMPSTSRVNTSRAPSGSLRFHEMSCAETLIADDVGRVELDGGLVRLAGLGELVESGLGRAELMPERRIGRERLKERIGVRLGVGMAAEFQAGRQCIAADLVTVEVEAEDAVVKEDEFGQSAWRSSALLQQVDELNLDVDVVGAEFEVLAQVADGDVGPAGFERRSDCRLRASGIRSAWIV